MNASVVRLLMWQAEEQGDDDLAQACRTVLAVIGDYATARERVYYDTAKVLVSARLPTVKT